MRFFILLIILPLYVLPYNDYSPSGARAIALGNTAVTLSDVWSSNNNQAGLAGINNTTAALYYENRFLVKELSTKYACIAVPLKKATLALSASSFGYSLFMKNKYGLAIAKKLGEDFSAGIQANYLTTYIGDNYGKTGRLSAELGMLYKPTKKISIGFHVFNPSHTPLTDYNEEKINTNIKLGASYNFSEKLLLVTEVEKEISGNIQFKTGLEYIPIKELYIRMGLRSHPSQFAFGFGLHLNKFKIDIASCLHPILGITNHAGLHYEFGK